MSLPPAVVAIASWNVDLSLRVERLPLRGETITGRDLTIGPGGKGSNAAIAAARQGAAVAVVARIGDDDFGRMGLDLWSREGIDSSAVSIARAERSGVAQILTYPDGDNSILIAPGANAGLDTTLVREAAPLIRQARVVVANFEVPLEAIHEAFLLARQAGALTVLNPAPASACLPSELLDLVDLLTPNETEVAALAGGQGAIAAQAQCLIDAGVRTVLVTRGAQGVSIYRGHEVPLHIGGHRMQVEDTVGAGDTFNGALAAALARGEALEQAARIANAAAALSVRAAGAIAGMPRIDEVDALLARSGR
jgi:ribokinase